jgi:hypothetical protein
MILVEDNQNAFKTAEKEDFRVSESLRLTEVKESPLLHSMRAELRWTLKTCRHLKTNLKLTSS